MKNVSLAFMFMFLLASCLQAQTEYTLDGAPTSLEEEFRWIFNRGRYDSIAENSARGTSYYDVPTSCGPLAPHESLTLAARHHCEDMATFDFFSHQTVTSLYYSVGDNFSDRISDEGYSGYPVGETIAASSGSPTPTSIYLLWWNSASHRQIAYNENGGEVGFGHSYDASSTWGNYYTMDMGVRTTTYLFTGALFTDSDGDDEYDQGEGVAGIKVTVLVGGIATDWYDVSEVAGSFAIPVSDVPVDTLAKIQLLNTTSNAITLAIPIDYSTCTNVALNASETLNLGFFTRMSSDVNLGLRDLTLFTSAPAPEATIWNAVEVAWSSISGVYYQVQWAPALDTNDWHDLGDPVLGNGSTNSVFYRTSGTVQRFFRVTVP